MTTPLNARQRSNKVVILIFVVVVVVVVLAAVLVRLAVAVEHVLHLEHRGLCDERRAHPDLGGALAFALLLLLQSGPKIEGDRVGDRVVRVKDVSRGEHAGGLIDVDRGLKW